MVSVIKAHIKTIGNAFALAARIKKWYSSNKNKHVDTENGVVVTSGGGLGRRMKWGKGINCTATEGN